MKVSFEMSEYTADTDGLGVLRLLNAMRSAGIEKSCKFYQARNARARLAAGLPRARKLCARLAPAAALSCPLAPLRCEGVDE